MSATPQEVLPAIRTVVSPVDSLTDALTTEKRLLHELITIMRRQRGAVSLARV